MMVIFSPNMATDIGGGPEVALCIWPITVHGALFAAPGSSVKP
jgi:hypothetical protein